MRKILLLFVVLAAVFVSIERQKLFVRDPLATVTRDGAKEAGAQVYINFSNDVLIENDNAPMYVELIQHGQPIGVPRETGCLHWMMCLMDAYPATLVGTSDGASIQSMDSKTVSITDSHAKQTVITLH